MRAWANGRVRGLLGLAVAGALGWGTAGLSQSANAAAISLQFALGYDNGVIGSGAGGQGSNAQAGLVPAANWNYVALNGAGAQGGSFSDLVDSGGDPTGLSGSYAFRFYVQMGGTDSSPNQQLYAAAVGDGYDGSGSNANTLTLTGIPYSNYNLIVYVEALRAGSAGSLTLDSGPALAIQPSYGDSSASPVVFTPITSSSASGNYVEYNGLSGTSHTLTLSMTNTTDAGIAGFQIVPAPEPATGAVVVAASSLGLLMRRRGGRR